MRQVGAPLCCSAWLSHCGAFLLRSTGSGAQASVVTALGLSSCGCVGLVAPQHVGSLQTRDRTHVPCISKQILIRCTTREVPRRDFVIPVSMLELPTSGVSRWSVQTSHNHLLSYPASGQEHFRYLSALPALCKTIGFSSCLAWPEMQFYH